MSDTPPKSVTAKHVFGPIPSRRLGRSLGVDTIPFKTCNWNCVYCQLGRTSPLTNERREYFPTGEILAQVAEAIERGVDAIDWITFVGSGEPTLHSGLGEMIRHLKSKTKIPIAVITNGSLLYLPEVRADLKSADAVLPTLDAGSEILYRKINRPTAELMFERLVTGLVAFRQEYEGKLWVEVMLVKGMNDTEAALQDLAAVLHRVRPDEVHINLPNRPPCEPWVQPPDEDGLRRATSILGEVAHVVRPAEGEFDSLDADNLVDSVVSIIMRHPMTEDQLIETLKRWNRGEIIETLVKLTQSGQAQVVTRQGQRFWSYSGARYVDEELSKCHGGSRMGEAS